MAQTEMTSSQGSRHRRRTDLRKIVGGILRYVVPAAVSVVLILWLLHKVDIDQVMATIRQGCDFRWIAAMMFLTMLSHIIRGIRWGIQLRAAGVPRIPVIAESVSIFGAYALNLLFPYLGEAWRCVYISNRENVKLSTVVGTDLGDRGSDAVVVALLLLLAVFAAHPVMESFFHHYHVGRDFDDMFTDVWTWIVIVAIVVGVWAFFHFFKGEEYVQGIKRSLMNIWNGFKVIFHMKGLGMYLVLTVGIWTCYFLETYCCFFAFPFTRELISQPGTLWGLIPGLVVFVFGSFSIAIPSNGGLGPWNIAVMFALTLYGVGQTDAAAYSITVWSFQAAMLVALGLFSACYISITRHKRRRAVAAS